jgi:hypothetical protein
VTAPGPPPEPGEVEVFVRRNGLLHLADSPSTTSWAGWGG